MPYYEQPASAPFYADDLTLADADGLKAFLAKVVKEMTEQYDAGSDGYRAARALASAVGAQIDELNLYFGDDEPATLTERMRAWNQVVFGVWPWEGAEGFDAHRWRLVHHRDLGDALDSARYEVQRLEKLAGRSQA